MYCLLIIFLLTFVKKNSYASHVLGAEFSYNCITTYKYLVTLKLYVDCAFNQTNQTNVNIKIYSNECGIFDIVRVLSRDSINEVSPLCSTTLSECEGGQEKGVKEITYSNEITLPDSTRTCSDWILSYASDLRSNQLTNIDTGFKLYTEALINNTSAICNNSPRFGVLPTPYYCNTPNVFEQVVVEEDGDSLVYQLIQPKHEKNEVIPYVPDFSLTEPLQSKSFDFDENSGRIEFIPDGEQISVITIKIEEYRSGVLVGSVMRDVEIIVFDCDNEAIELCEGSYVDNVYEICPGDILKIDYCIKDSKGDSLIIINNANKVLGRPLDTIYYDVIDSMVHLEWATTESDTGTYYLIVGIKDDVCPVPATLTTLVKIEVKDIEVNVGDDRVYCLGAEPIKLEVSGGKHFSWQPKKDIITANQDSSIVSVAPTQSMEYTVTNSCGNSDTIAINVVDAFTMNVLIDSSSINGAICSGDVIQLLLDVGNNGGYSFEWYPNEYLSVSNIANPTVTVTDIVMYYVTVTSMLTECTQIDSVKMPIDNIISKIILPKDTVVVCKGTPFPLIIDYERINGNSSTTNVPTISLQPTGGLDNSTSFNPIVNIDTTTTYTITLNNNGCVLQENITFLVESITPTLLSNFEMCEGESVLLELQGQLPADAIYQWQPSTGLSCTDCRNPVARPLSTTTYKAQVTSTSGCSQNLTTEVLVKEASTFDIIVGTDPYQLRTTLDNSIAEIQWSPADYLSDPTSPNPFIQEDFGTTTYTATAVYSNACTVTVTQQVVAPKEKCKVVFPAVFSPNDDGINDRLFIPKQKRKIELLSFDIFNRWGKKVFNTTNIGEGWDGSFNFHPQDSGTYIYVLEYVCSNTGKEMVESGRLILVR